jgi:hypothetical protein
MADRRRPESEEIEITPEMIEAGKLELSDYTPDWCTAEEVVADVFRAMMGASKLKNT